MAVTMRGEGREREKESGKSGATDISSSSERTISRVRIIYARNQAAAGACKLIGKMVVKVNLVGSQGSGSRLAQVVRARRPRSRIRGGQEPKLGETRRNRSSFACVCASLCICWRLTSSANAFCHTRREQNCIELSHGVISYFERKNRAFIAIGFTVQFYNYYWVLSH